MSSSSRLRVVPQRAFWRDVDALQVAFVSHRALDIGMELLPADTLAAALNATRLACLQLRDRIENLLNLLRLVSLRSLPGVPAALGAGFSWPHAGPDHPAALAGFPCSLRSGIQATVGTPARCAAMPIGIIGGIIPGRPQGRRWARTPPRLNVAGAAVTGAAAGNVQGSTGGRHAGLVSP